MAIVDDLKWRHASKQMNGETVSPEKIDYILEAARLAPSSGGLQQFKIFVISNKEKLEELKVIANNQRQVAECSHLLVWAAWDKLDPARVEHSLSETNKLRGLSAEATAKAKQFLLSAYAAMSEEWMENHYAKQTYISFGTAIAAAAEQRVDSSPMEGFDNEKMDEYLGLNKIGLKSTVILALGYRHPDDFRIHLKKWRTPKEEFIVELK